MRSYDLIWGRPASYDAENASYDAKNASYEEPSPHMRSFDIIWCLALLVALRSTQKPMMKTCSKRKKNQNQSNKFRPNMSRSLERESWQWKSWKKCCTSSLFSDQTFRFLFQTCKRSGWVLQKSSQLNRPWESALSHGPKSHEGNEGVEADTQKACSSRPPKKWRNELGGEDGDVPEEEQHGCQFLPGWAHQAAEGGSCKSSPQRWWSRCHVAGCGKRERLWPSQEEALGLLPRFAGPVSQKNLFAGPYLLSQPSQTCSWPQCGVLIYRTMLIKWGGAVLFEVFHGIHPLCHMSVVIVGSLLLAPQLQQHCSWEPPPVQALLQGQPIPFAGLCPFAGLPPSALEVFHKKPFCRACLALLFLFCKFCQQFVPFSKDCCLGGLGLLAVREQELNQLLVGFGGSAGLAQSNSRYGPLILARARHMLQVALALATTNCDCVLVN